MRMRLGILHDPEAQQRMHEREQRAADEKKRKADAPTVRSELEQKKHEEQKAKQTQQPEDGGEVKKEEKKKVKIRPLSDARAIELGANFFSEAFIFGVAVGLLLLENYRSRSKESARRDEVAERLEGLEAQVEKLSSQHHLPELEALNEKIKRAKEARGKTSWYNPVGWFRSSDGLDSDDDDDDVPGEVEGTGGKAEAPKTKTSNLAEQVRKAKDTTDVGSKDGKESKPPDLAAAKKAERIETVDAVARGR